MSIKDGIFGIIGKTVKEVIVNDECPSSPDFHLFLLFDDGGAYEFYGNGILNSSGSDHGGLNYAKIFNDCRMRRYYINEQGERVTEDIK